MEAFLRDDDYFVKVDGQIVVEPITKKKMTNSESFKRKCGAKKVDDIQLRLEKMINCFNSGGIYPIGHTLFPNQSCRSYLIYLDE